MPSEITSEAEELYFKPQEELKNTSMSAPGPSPHKAATSDQVGELHHKAGMLTYEIILHVCKLCVCFFFLLPERGQNLQWLDHMIP